MKKLICALFKHPLFYEGMEDGKGKEFRYINKCKCGKRVKKSDWTDDNQVLGHGKY